jgi:DNA integrity scanning protein DisA with diadenylate cyclase activity
VGEKSAEKKLITNLSQDRGRQPHINLKNLVENLQNESALKMKYKDNQSSAQQNVVETINDFEPNEMPEAMTIWSLDPPLRKDAQSPKKKE